MIRRLLAYACDCVLVYLVADLVLELGGRAERLDPARVPYRPASPDISTARVFVVALDDRGTVISGYELADDD